MIVCVRGGVDETEGGRLQEKQRFGAKRTGERSSAALGAADLK